MPELKLNKELQDTLANFSKSLQNAYQYDLVSVIIYGSAASGEFADATSNLNVLVVLKNTGLPYLKAAASLVNKLIFRRISPLFLTEDYIKTSLDVFPIEFLDMKEKYTVLFGQDVLKSLNINLKNLRFQCEQELKAKLIILKQDYLKINQRDKKALGNLLFKNFTSVIHILRNVVRLKGKTPSYLKAEVLREVAVELSIPITLLMKILAAKNNPVTLTLADIQAMLADFTQELEKIIKAVDKL